MGQLDGDFESVVAGEMIVEGELVKAPGGRAYGSCLTCDSELGLLRGLMERHSVTNQYSHDSMIKFKSIEACKIESISKDKKQRPHSNHYLQNYP